MNQLSVIVPFHNDSQWVDKLALSLENQINKKFDLILVSDGATKTHQQYVLKKTAKIPQCKLYKQENAGLAAACNLGLAAIKTEWCVFLDVDDYVSEDFVDLFYQAIKRNKKATLVASQLVQQKTGKKPIFLKFNRNNYMFQSGLKGNKFYKKSLVNFCFCEKVQMGEDTIFYLEYLQNAINLEMTTGKFFYLKRSGSHMHTASAKTILSLLNAYDYLKTRYDLSLPKNKYLVEFIYKHLYIYTYVRLKIINASLTEYKTKTKKMGPLRVLRKSGWKLFFVSLLMKAKFYWVVNIIIFVYKKIAWRWGFFEY